MSMLIAALVCVPLLAISLAHFIWSFGGTWPIRDEKLLAHAVVGTPGRDRMPRFASLGVAIATLVAAVCALALADPSGGGWSLTLIGLALALVFLLRGGLGYTAWWRARTPVEPFRSYDRKLYAPLCLLLGAGFLVLVTLRLLA